MDDLLILSRQIQYNSHNEHMEAKKRIKSICSKKELDAILEDVILTDDELTIIQMHYLKGYNLSFVADSLCYSEKTIKRMHDKALKKIGNTI